MGARRQRFGGVLVYLRLKCGLFYKIKQSLIGRKSYGGTLFPTVYGKIKTGGY